MSYERSPRGLCSTTMGTSGMGLRSSGCAQPCGCDGRTVAGNRRVARPAARSTGGRLAAMPLRVVALPTGRVQIHPRQTRGVGPDALRPLAVVAERGFTEPLPVLSWAIVHPDGVIVVDAGQAPDFAAPWWDVYTRTAVRFHVGPQDALPARLLAVGLD